REHDTAIVFVSHDLGVVHEIADTVAVVKDGRIVEAGPRDQIYHGAHQPYTRELLAASRLHSVDTIRAPRPLSGSTNAQPLLTVHALRKSYRKRTGRGRRTVVDDLSFTIGSGEIVGLVGESGSGKSTVGRIVAGLQYADSGEITLAASRYPTAISDGVPPLSPDTRRAVQLVFQDPYSSLNPRRSVADSLAAPLV